MAWINAVMGVIERWDQSRDFSRFKYLMITERVLLMPAVILALLTAMVWEWFVF
jgi:hypothetical protein